MSRTPRVVIGIAVAALVAAAAVLAIQRSRDEGLWVDDDVWRKLAEPISD